MLTSIIIYVLLAGIFVGVVVLVSFLVYGLCEVISGWVWERKMKAYDKHDLKMTMQWARVGKVWPLFWGQDK